MSYLKHVCRSCKVPYLVRFSFWGERGSRRKVGVVLRESEINFEWENRGRFHTSAGMALKTICSRINIILYS